MISLDEYANKFKYHALQCLRSFPTLFHNASSQSLPSAFNETMVKLFLSQWKGKKWNKSYKPCTSACVSARMQSMIITTTNDGEGARVWENEKKKKELWIEQTMKNVTEIKLTTNTLGFNEHYCCMRRFMISESAKTIYLQHNLHFPRAFQIAFLNLLFNVSKKRLGEEKKSEFNEHLA